MGHTRFFYLSMLYINLRIYYETTHIMHTKLNYSLHDVMNMYPYERDFFILMAVGDAEKEKARLEKQRMQNGKLSF